MNLSNPPNQHTPQFPKPAHSQFHSFHSFCISPFLPEHTWMFLEPMWHWAAMSCSISCWVAAIHAGKFVGDMLGRDVGMLWVNLAGWLCLRYGITIGRVVPNCLISYVFRYIELVIVVLHFCVDCFRSLPYHYLTYLHHLVPRNRYCGLGVAMLLSNCLLRPDQVIISIA